MQEGAHALLLTLDVVLLLLELLALARGELALALTMRAAQALLAQALRYAGWWCRRQALQDAALCALRQLLWLDVACGAAAWLLMGWRWYGAALAAAALAQLWLPLATLAALVVTRGQTAHEPV